MKINYNLLGKNLKTKRTIEMDLDMRTLAEELGISTGTISRVENGKPCSLETYLVLCSWLEIHPKEYMINAVHSSNTNDI